VFTRQKSTLEKVLHIRLNYKLRPHFKVLKGMSHPSEEKKGGQADGLISIGKLSTLLCVHTQPIDHIVYMESHRDTLS
jgi:hypothetical protein